MLLRNLKAPDGVFIDLLVEDGKIVAVGLVGTLTSDGEEIDCGGRVVFPGFVDAHAHMDKTLARVGLVSQRRGSVAAGYVRQRTAICGWRETSISTSSHRASAAG